MALKVLKQQAEQPVGSGNKEFPKGTWKFTIQTPTGERTRPTPDFMHNADAVNGDKLARVAGETGEILSLWLGEAEALEKGQDDPGKQIFFQDFVIKDGEYRIDEVDVEDPHGVGWQILRDARLLSNLAIALGATTEVEEGEDTFTVAAENFVDMLLDGDFDGQQVIAKVRHRPWKSKATGKSGINAEIEVFAAAG